MCREIGALTSLTAYWFSDVRCRPNDGSYVRLAQYSSVRANRKHVRCLTLGTCAARVDLRHKGRDTMEYDGRVRYASQLYRGKTDAQVASRMDRVAPARVIRLIGVRPELQLRRQAHRIGRRWRDTECGLEAGRTAAPVQI